MTAQSDSYALLKSIADNVAKHAHRAILTAHERFEAGEDEVPWSFGELNGAAKMHPDGDPEDRTHVRTTGAEYAASMAMAHANGAMLGMMALIQHAEQEEAREQAAAGVAAETLAERGLVQEFNALKPPTGDQE